MTPDRVPQKPSFGVGRLARVPPKLKSEVAWSLWRRIDSEFGSGGPGAVTSYLRSQFEEIATRLRTELAAAEDIGTNRVCDASDAI